LNGAQEPNQYYQQIELMRERLRRGKDLGGADSEAEALSAKKDDNKDQIEQAESARAENDAQKEGTDMQINIKINQVKIQMCTDISQPNQSPDHQKENFALIFELH